jgi:hypothetical protein
LNDGRHTVSIADAIGGFFADISTDASGDINAWRLVLNTGGVQNGGIATINKQSSVFDQGILACCDPTVSGNLGEVFGSAGTWTSSTAVCEIRLNKGTYITGDAVSVQAFRFANTGSTPIPVEIKVWLEVPGIAPIPFIRSGVDGSVSLPANSNVNLAPFTLFTVTAQAPRGSYAFSCRLLNPVTGKLLSASLQPFSLQ